jgi:hypothetical protein
MAIKTFNCVMSVIENSDDLYVYKVTLENEGHSGSGKDIFLGDACQEAFEDLMSKVDPNYKMALRKL